MVTWTNGTKSLQMASEYFDITEHVAQEMQMHLYLLEHGEVGYVISLLIEFPIFLVEYVENIQSLINYTTVSFLSMVFCITAQG